MRRRLPTALPVLPLEHGGRCRPVPQKEGARCHEAKSEASLGARTLCHRAREGVRCLQRMQAAVATILATAQQLSQYRPQAWFIDRPPVALAMILGIDVEPKEAWACRT
jgi:hypothetical protein